MSSALEIVTVAAPAPYVPAVAKRRLEDVARDVRELASAEGASFELLRILPDLGPVFSGFARYLATRADRVPAGLRSDLATVADHVTPAPFAEIRAAVELAWHRSIDDVCFGFDELPVQTRFPVQTHRAWLTPTDAITVSCVPASFEARLAQDLPLLPQLSKAFAGAVGGAEVFDALVADYRVLTGRLADFSDDVALSEAIVSDARRFPPLRPRRPHPGLSSARVAVWDEIAGVTPDTPGFNHVEAGSSICRAWLRQALLGRTFPEQPAPEDFVICGRRQTSVGGRLFTIPTTDAQLTWQGYLVGTAAGDPDLVIKFLLRELVAGPRVDAAGFQRRMRHAWSVDSDAAGGSELMAQLLLHWRIAVQHGYQPKPRLAAFYRGCLAAVSAATAMGAEADVLRDSLEALQIRLMTFQFETMTGITSSAARTVREAGWRFLTAIASGPVALDRVAATPGVSLSIVASLLLAMTAIGVAMPVLVASGAAWADSAGAALVAALGGVALFHILFRRSQP